MTFTADDLATTVQAMAGAVLTNFCGGDQVLQASDEIIQHLREELKACPQEVSLALASALLARFAFGTHSIDDCEEAIIMLDNHIASTSSDWYRVRASELIALLSLARSIFYSDLEYSEEAIVRCRAVLNLSSLDEQLRVVFTQALAIHAEQRFRTFGLTDGLREAVSLLPEIANLSSSAEVAGVLYASRCAYPTATVLEKIQQLEDLLITTTSDIPQHTTCLEDLACWYDTKFSRTGDASDIKAAIRYRRILLTPPHSNHPLIFIPIGFLCDDLLLAFDLTHSMDYLEESIILHRVLLTKQDARPLRFTVIRRLVLSLCVRFRSLRHSQDLEEIMRLCSMAVHDTHASVVDRFKFACLWASLARHFRHLSVSNAYESAVSLLQPSLTLAPNVQGQLIQLLGMGETCERMPLDYASYLIGSGYLERAIEILERGRTLLWSELRGFRASVDHPVSSHLLLAEKFATVNRKLKALALSGTLRGDTDVDDGRVRDREVRWMDPFSRIVTKQRELSKERSTLISHIQSLPGLGDFLSPPSFEKLRCAASRGPVIIVNHSKWRSDILILLRDSPPSLIPTPNDFYDRANRLKDRLLSERRELADVVGSTEHANALRYVLAELYALVGRPVIERLHELGVPEQSRVWWCPTSAFCYLPLHAMGPIPSGDNAGRYFSDLYIPSYTPSLSALIDSRQPISRTSDRPSLLLVAHHDRDLCGMKKEIKAIKRLSRPRVKSLVGKKATAAVVTEGLQQHHFAHIACSYKRAEGRPLDARLVLHGDDSLTLLDFARCRLPVAEFAFLSTSHTAGLIDESIPDESLHLASAMQHCGFRSVVGTMWGMADMDGTDVCKRFYKLLFAKGGKEAPPYHERAAKALRDTVQKLRKKKGMTLDRWVTYVHYGA